MTHIFEAQSVNEIIFATPQEKQKISDIIQGPFPAATITGILLYGPPGTGKTTLAGLLPHAIEAQRTGNPDAKAWVIHNSHCKPQDNGTQTINSVDKALRNVSIANASQLHYVVLNEADNLTKQALAHLKSLMETKETIFILTTNNVKAFSGPVSSRCDLVSFEPVTTGPMADRLEHILNAEGIADYQRPWLETFVRQNNFDGRKIFRWLQKIVLDHRSKQAVTQTP